MNLHTTTLIFLEFWMNLAINVIWPGWWNTYYVAQPFMHAAVFCNMELFSLLGLYMVHTSPEIPGAFKNGVHGVPGWLS